VTADPAECSFQFNPVGTRRLYIVLRRGQWALVKRGIPYENAEAPARTVASVAIGGSGPCQSRESHARDSGQVLDFTQ
jgi:hypothetical protein